MFACNAEDPAASPPPPHADNEYNKVICTSEMRNFEMSIILPHCFIRAADHSQHVPDIREAASCPATAHTLASRFFRCRQHSTHRLTL